MPNAAEACVPPSRTPRSKSSAETYLYKRFKAAKIGRGLFQGKPKAYSGITKS
jgi:hypothetical protein